MKKITLYIDPSLKNKEGHAYEYFNTISSEINKREFKVETVVSVNVDLLRKNLEDANILKSLTSGF